MTGWLSSMLDHPEVDRAFKEARDRMDRSIEVRCAWGTCTYFIDPIDQKVYSGWGDPFCGCENLPGWRSPRIDGMPKPGAAVKARGRHGSRVQRSKHRRADWLKSIKETI